MLKSDPNHKFSLEQLLPGPIITNAEQSEVWSSEVSFYKSLRYAIIAPSGRGKSTLAHILYGLRQDYSGQLKYGQSIIGDNSLQLLNWRREDWAIVFQDLRLFPELTALENIRLHQEMCTAPLSEEILQHRAQLMGIENMLAQKVSSLSFGQQQRVAILRAISRPFNWLILDEPFSHLDEENASIALAILEEERQRHGAGMILFCLNAVPKGMEVDEVFRL